jgi:hypothetical protein
MQIVATPEAVDHIVKSGGLVYVWTVQMVYGYGFEKIFALEASTESPGAEREFLRFEGDEFELLYDPGDKGTPDSIHLALVGRFRKKIRAYWNGHSYGRDS